MGIYRDPLDGAPTALPIATAAEFSPSPDGTQIVYRYPEHSCHRWLALDREARWQWRPADCPELLRPLARMVPRWAVDRLP